MLSCTHNNSNNIKKIRIKQIFVYQYLTCCACPIVFIPYYYIFHVFFSSMVLCTFLVYDNKLYEVVLLIEIKYMD